MELKQFRNKYDLELIPASHKGIIIGNLVWDPLIGKPSFDHPGMPNHIFNAFRDANLLDQGQFEVGLKECKRTRLVDAKMADMVIDVDRNLTASLDHPQIEEVGTYFKLEMIKKFTFGELKVRTASNLLRVQIDSYLEQLKVNDWELYDGRIRNVFIITELYFGSIKMIINTNIKEDFLAALEKSDLKLSGEVSFANSVQYTFDHQDVPFAMRLEKVKHFNG